eukprot:TRINITY_DN3136_c0_g1_i3.p1 TRINITY_DN3136_c0_g1~~TRINITY_DN3136_c0_g1_i3.p1  ORF type:complete len:260 (+),score=24.55 TRINITY_DN3136_c0_g1_i3:88-867(+)
MDLRVSCIYSNVEEIVRTEEGWSVAELRAAVAKQLNLDESLMSLQEGGNEVTQEVMNGFDFDTQLHVTLTREGEVLSKLRSLGITNIGASGLGPALLKSSETDPTLCRNLLTCGVDPNYCEPRTGKTALRLAAGKGYCQLCELLLDLGAKLDGADKRGWTPLHAAASWGRTDACRMLLGRGSDINAVCNAGKTPLHTASASEHFETCKLLVSHGANVRATDKLGRDALFYCSYKNGTSRLHAYIFRQMQSQVVGLFSRV